MTVLIRVAGAKDYIGLSSDSKPMNVAEGSTYFSVDPGILGLQEHWVFHDLMWEIDYAKMGAAQAVLEL